jgi:hypothetical protein
MNLEMCFHSCLARLMVCPMNVTSPPLLQNISLNVGYSAGELLFWGHREGQVRCGRLFVLPEVRIPGGWCARQVFYKVGAILFAHAVSLLNT